jgi:hypothetical protein
VEFDLVSFLWTVGIPAGPTHSEPPLQRGNAGLLVPTVPATAELELASTLELGGASEGSDGEACTATSCPDADGEASESAKGCEVRHVELLLLDLMIEFWLGDSLMSSSAEASLAMT